MSVTPNEELERFKENYEGCTCSTCPAKVSEAKETWLAPGPEEALLEERYKDVELICPSCE